MTTVIGIAGKDPETLEDYVVLCADSRGTLYGRTPLDVKKVFTEENANYAFAVAGKCLEYNFSKDFEPEIYNFINKPKTESEEYIKKILKIIDDALLKQYGERNSILLSIKKDAPELMKLSEKGFAARGAYECIGSGSDYTNKLESLEDYIEDQRVLISKRDALNIAFEAMNEAASKDKYTGGNMNVAIITGSGIKVIPSYRCLDKSSFISAPLLEDGDAPQNIMIHPYQRDD